MELAQSRHEDQESEASADSRLIQNNYFDQSETLYTAALNGDWDAAQDLLRNDLNSLAITHMTQGHVTALHVAALEGHDNFVRRLLEKMEEAADIDPEIQDNLHAKKILAFCYAAAAGRMSVARVLVDNDQSLPASEARGTEFTPLYMAVLQGHQDLADFLYTESVEFEYDDLKKKATELSTCVESAGLGDVKNKAELLTTSIHSGLYDLAKKILKRNKMLAVAIDKNGETPLDVLARKPLAFCGTSRRGFRGDIVGTVLSYMQSKASNTSAPCDAYELFDYLWNIVKCQEDIETAHSNFSGLLFEAAKSGNDGFVVELIRRRPILIFTVDSSKQSIFHIAVSHRYVDLFNLIYELGGAKDFIASYIDENNDNILHLAAKLSPQDQLNGIPGAALQMQREVIWYKVVEKMVRPAYRYKKNKDGKTPYDLFLEEHEELKKEGEKQMKQIAKSCMLVTMLITAVVFTTVFTAPGGYNNDTGAPLLVQNKKLFTAFYVSEAAAALASFISILMFLSVLTSRYSDNDFLRWLPIWLVVGVAALSVSIVAMMATFCTCLLFYENGRAFVIVILVLLASVPVMFLILKCSLLITIIGSTYNSEWLFRSKGRLQLLQTQKKTKEGSY